MWRLVFIVVRVGSLVLGVLGLCLMVADAEVHGPKLRDDKMVQEAYQHFYVLDYPTCVSILQKVQKSHPGDPLATTFLLEARVFQELYRQDLLDTTLLCNGWIFDG